MLINFNVSKERLEEIPNNLSFDEKIYKIVSESFDKINDGTYDKWDIHDIQEVDDGYTVILKVSNKDKNSECCECCEDNHDNNSSYDVDENIPEEQPMEKSVAYNGPWSDKKFELDIAQAVAFFESIQFCDYLIKLTQAVTPVAARSVQECQRYILENFTKFNIEDFKTKEIDPNEPLKIELTDEFEAHVKQWQEESMKIFEKLVAESKKKPQIVSATMMPKDGFDPKGPAGGLKL